MPPLNLLLGRTLLPRLVALLSLLTALGAGAQPYEFLAVYEPLSGAGEAHAIRLDATEGTLLPDGGERHQLDRIIVRFKSDGISTSTLSAFSRLRFSVKVGDGAATTVSVATDDIEKLPEREATLRRWRGDGNKDALARVSISVQSIYSRQFLCLQELLLLEQASNKKDRTGWIDIQTIEEQTQPVKTQPVKPQPVKPQPVVVTDGTSSTRQVLRTGDDGPFLLYSFCQHAKTVKWPELVAAIKDDTANTGARLHFGFGLDADKLNEKQLFTAHKQALSQLLVDQLNTRFSTLGDSAVDKEDEAYDKSLVYVRDAHDFSIIKSAGSLMLVEELGGAVAPLADLIDQDAEVALALNQEVCFQLSPGELMRSPWTFELEVLNKDGAPQTVEAPLDFRHGCKRQVLVRWQDYLDQRVTFRIIYRVPQREDIVIFKDSFQIYNLGLITTVPVITEIVAAAQSASPRDIESKSKIPVSWALSVREGQRNSYAVTFPFTLGVNTREFPNLARYISLAPSVSLLAGGGVARPGAEEDPDVRVAFGLGVNLVEAFHFGYAWTPAGGGGRYVLIGVSIPNLLPLLEGL